MRIGLDLRYIYDHFPGIGRYFANLAAALVQLEPRHTFVLITNPALPNTRHRLDGLAYAANTEVVTTTARPFALAEQVQMPALVRRLRLDLYHSPYYVMPYAVRSCPTVVTVHDLLPRRFPSFMALRDRLIFNGAMWLAVHTASCIITVSHSARRDIAATYGIPIERIAVTPEAADRRFTPQPAVAVEHMRRRYGLPPRYVLYLGANKPHKNVVRLVQAWQRLTTQWATTPHTAPSPLPHLVIAGHYDARYPQAHHLVAAAGLRERVTFLHDVAEEHLPALYSGAEVFVFVSFYEGFGLPPLEAMACGVPLLCAYTSSLPEVAGRAAMMVNPFSVAQIAAGLQQMLDNAALRAYMRGQALQQARSFSWQRTAEETLQVYAALGTARR